MKASKRGKAAAKEEKKSDEKEAKSKRLETLHRRLYEALNLGSRYYDEKVWKWKSTDIEIQRHVVRSVTSLLNCVHVNTSDHSLLKDSVADMVAALAWILKHKSASVLSIAAKAVVKLISTIHNSMLQPHLLELVDPLSSLLSFPQLDVSISCVTALNMLLSNLSVRDEKMVWEILNETVNQSTLINNVVRSFNGNLLREYFEEMASLLSTVLHRWPPTRYTALSDAKLMEVLKIFYDKPDISLAIPILNLCSAIALCGHGAKKLLENAGMLLPTVVIYMGDSYSLSVRLEAFRLARRLVENEQGCLTLMGCYCEPFVEAIISGMSVCMTHLGKVPNEQMFLLVEACHLALVLRWPGKHHGYFWKQGIDRVLISLLLGDLHAAPSQHILALEDQISKAKEDLQKNCLVNLRPYVWDILGWLSAHHSKDSKPNLHTSMDTLITCACLSFVDSVRSGVEDLANAFRSESTTRVALMMIYCPCREISSKVISVLSEVLKPTGKALLKRIISTLDAQSLSNDIGMLGALQAGINLAALACCAALPEYNTHIVDNGGIKTLMHFTKQCLNNNVQVGRMNIAPHLRNQFREKTCCLVNEDWEGNDILLLYGFMGLAELLHLGSIANVADIFAGQIEYTESQFISMLKDICSGTYSMGVKWYAAYILGYFDYYGFPSKIGNHIWKAFSEKKHVDMQLILAKRNPIDVHGGVLASRCPALLPPESLASNEKPSGSSMGNNLQKQLVKSEKHVHLSSHVDSEALIKLLEFLYSGCLHAEQDIVRKLKVLARHCNLQSLLLVLGRKRPNWGMVWPCYDLTIALGSTGHCHSDIILEAKSTESLSWKCDICSTEVPHVHAHRIILWSRCDYMQALLDSGTKDSTSHTIKVPLSYEAMSKLVKWFYSDELPNPPSGCIWDGMSADEKLRAVQPCLELCWLAGFWCLDEVKDISLGVVLSCLDSSKDLSTKIIQIAASLSLWDVVDVAAGYLAPLYRQLCDSGDLEVLEEELVEMIRDASVRLSQETC